MRFIFFLAILFFVTSCGALNLNSGSLRLVKTNNKETVVLEKELKSVTSDLVSPQLETANPPENHQQVIAANTNNSLNNKSSLVHAKTSFISKISDVEPSDEENEAIVRQAIKAEKQANASFGLFLAGLISLTLPYLGIIPFIIGLVLYLKAKNSRYITPFGDERLRKAKVVLIVDSVILALWFLMVILVFILIF